MALVGDYKNKKSLDLNEGGIELLFPKWEKNNERVAFLCAHDDDAAAGAGFLINKLTKDFGADVHLLVCTDARYGFNPDLILKSYPDVAKDTLEYIRNKTMDINISMDDLVGRLDSGKLNPSNNPSADDTTFRKFVSAYLNDKIADIRSKETVESYGKLGVPKDNINYFKDKEGKTIGDLCMPPYMTLKTADGSDGLYAWLIRSLRDMDATRLLTLNPGDSHIDHQLASYLGVNIGNRAKGNLWTFGGNGLNLKNNAANTHGLHYVIYETMTDDLGTIYSGNDGIKNKIQNKIPSLGLLGNRDDHDSKLEALKAYKSQPGLVPVFSNMNKDVFGENSGKVMELFEYFPSSDKLIKKNHGYHNAYLEMFGL